MDAHYGAQYARLYREHWWWRAREHLLSRTLDRILNPGDAGEVLDFGCGDGLFFDVLKRYGTPNGIEPDASLLDPSGPWRSQITTDYVEYDDTQTGRFGLVVALDVLEHIQEPLPIVRELTRRLRPGGWFLATVPAFQQLWTRHDDLNNHVRRYTLAELEELVAEGGLSVFESRYFFVWLAAVKLGVVVLESIVPGSPRPPRVPWSPVNGLLFALARTEQQIVGRSTPPFGSSALILARRPPA